VWRESASVQEGVFEDLEDIAGNDLVYQAMVKEGVIDIDLVRQKFVQEGKPGAYQEFLKEFDMKLTKYRGLPGEGNFTQIYDGLETVEGTDNVIFKSFLRALDGEGTKEQFYNEMLSLTGKRKERQLQEIMEVLHVGRGTGDLSEDAFIGASRTLLGYWYDIQKSSYESEFAAQNKAAGIKGGKSSLSQAQKNIAIERALKDAGEYLPSTDINEAIDLYSEYAGVVYPEMSPFLNIKDKQTSA